MAASMMLTALSAGQTFPTLKGDNARTGVNATPAISHPGRGFLTWFRPNANDVLSGTIVRNNTAQAPANVNFTPGFLPAPATDLASFFYEQPSIGDQASDIATGSFAVYPLAVPPYDGRTPAYHYTPTVASTSRDNPEIGATQSFTWFMDPTAPPISQGGTGPGFARNYALYVWLPIGSTATAFGRQFPQRFFVYQINYGPGAGQTYIEVVDTYAAGTGWVRLGNAGSDTNRMFQYDGTTPIRISLLNTVPIDPNTNLLTDIPGSSLVYADAAMAVPQIGVMDATPTVSYLLGSLQGRAIAAVNRLSVGTRNGRSTTVSQGEVTSYNYADGSIDNAVTGRRWVFRPAEQAFTVTMDNTVATNNGFTSMPVGPGSASALGTDYYTSQLIATPGPASRSVTYSPTLEDGDYEIQVYLSPDTLTEQFGTATEVEVHEGATVTLLTINQNRGPGWFSVSTQKFRHTQTDPLEFVVTNVGGAADVGKFAFADAVRFIGAFDAEVNSTPTSARVFVRQNGGALVEQDVVIVAAEDGRIYCLDAEGNADGTTNVIWAYPSIADPTDPAWTDPNNNTPTSPDGQNNVTLAEMPIGFGRTSPIVQRIGGVDYVMIAARNGRVYCIDAAGRGDYNFATRRPGTTTRNWTYPNDYPQPRRAGSLGSFTNSSIAYAEVGGTPRLYVPTESGHMYALDPVGNPVTRTTTVLWDFPGRTQQLAPITTTPAIFNGRIYFGTTIDSAGVGHFYSVDAATGNTGTAQEFVPTPSVLDPAPPELRGFFGGPAAVDGATIGGGAISTIFVSNNNLNIYALDAANINNVIWRTSELNTTVTGPLTFTPMMVFDTTAVPNLYPTVVVPGDNGQWSALFARGGAVGAGVVNSFGGKFAWGKIATGGIVAGTAVGAPPGAPGFLYGGDTNGNLFAFSNVPTIGGQGEPPMQDIIEPDNPDGAAWRNAKIKIIDKALYDSLRADPMVTPYTTVDTFPQTPPYAFEWGQTAYFVVYDFPFQETLTGGPAVSPSIVNVQISTEGATTRQFTVVARQFPAGAPAQRDGYAVLAFAIQGSGPNSLPPGSGRVSYSVTPGRAASNQRAPQVAQNPASFIEFRVANPIAIDMSPAANDEIGVTNLTNDPGALANGTPNLASTAANNETLLTTTIGLTGHGATGNTTIHVYDRSWMTFLRGPGRGVDQVRVNRPELAWLGGSAAINKMIPVAPPFGDGFTNFFEDLPEEQPNISLDYPNIRAENVRATKDPNGQSENPGYSGVFLKPPTTSGGAPLINETDAPTRALVPTPFLFEVDVPRFQPANNFVAWNTSIIGQTVQSGYSGRVSVFVDSNNDGQLNRLSGRLEANRGFFLNGSVAMDESIEVRTPNVDLGSLPGGAGYSPLPPGLGGSNFNPWTFPVGGILAGSADYVGMFKPFVVENPGNVNLLNLRVAKATNQGANRFSWGIYSTSVDEFGWMDAGVGLWSDIDSVFARTPQVILQKPRVGDRSASVLQTNPVIRPNPNLNTNGGRLLPAPFSDNPRVAVTLPIGFPVGTYSQVMRVIEDANLDESLALNGNNALEAFSDPTFILGFKARETRLTNDHTRLTAPMSDEASVLGTAGAAFLHQNLQPTAARISSGASIGHLLVAWTSSRSADTATQPTNASANDRYRLFLAGLNGGNAVPDPRSDPNNPIQDLTGFVRSTNSKWFTNSPGSANGYPAPGYLFPSVAGESVVAGSEKYGAPSLPARGQVNAVAGVVSPLAQFPNFDISFVGEAQKQTPAGRVAESRLFTTRVTMQANGEPAIDPTPYPMPYDIYSQKGRASIVRLGDLSGTPAADDLSFIAYSALSAGNSRIFWTTFDYQTRTDATTGGYTRPQAIEFGDGFESVSSPSLTVRPYVGTAGLGAAIFDISFTGKLRGRKNSEVFQGRLPFATPSAPVNYPALTEEVLVPDTETGQFRARGIEWDQNQPIELRLRNNLGASIPVETAGTRRLDKNTGLIVFDTSLGGKAYLDPRMGTVRLSTGLPLSTQQLVLTYTPKFLRVSVGTTAGYAGVSQFYDTRVDGVRPPTTTKYWARPDNSSIVAGDAPRLNRYFLSYNRAAAGAGQAARPFMKTMRLGVQLPYQIYTDANGNLLRSPGVPSIQVAGADGFFQVDPVKGRVYFSGVDEDDVVTVTFNGVDQSTGQPTGIGGNANTPFVIQARVSLVTEMDETPVPIEQAVNESNMYAFPDPFDNPAFPRPNLVWMFWSSTRGGSPDLYFQTVAPRFAPQVSGN
jgi:hypothetical protein